MAGYGGDLDLERDQPPNQSAADGAVAEDHGGRAVEPTRPPVRPLAVRLATDEVGQILRQRQHRGEHELRDAGLVDSNAPTERDARRKVGRDPVDARGQHLDHAQAREALQHRQGLRPAHVGRNVELNARGVRASLRFGEVHPFCVGQERAYPVADLAVGKHHPMRHAAGPPRPR